MNPYPVSVCFDLDRAEDRAALTWLSRCRGDGFKTYSAAVIAVINDYRDRKERLTADPYLETREKEDAFLRRVLETVRQGMEESAGGNLSILLRILQTSQPDAGGSPQSPRKCGSEPNTEDLESISVALDFVDAL